MKRPRWWWFGMVLATPAITMALIVLLLAVAETFHGLSSSF